MFRFTLSLFFLTVAASAQEVPGIPGAPLVYRDNFNKADPFYWTMFEEGAETVNCAIHDVGVVERTTDFKSRGKGGLMVASNYANEQAGSNHVLAQRKLANVGLTGRIRYSVWSLVNTTILPDTQTGPEMSLQSTRAVELGEGGQPIHRTFIGGLQYVGNKYVTNKWNIWNENRDDEATEADAQIAEWTPIGEELNIPDLDIDGWWKITFVVDFTKNKYIKLKLQDPNGVIESYGLKSYKVAREVRFHEGNFGATLEAQNMYVGDCSGVNTHRAYYDNVKILQQGDAIVPAVPLVSDQYSTVNVGESEDLVVGENIIIAILVDAGKGTLDTNGGTLTYIATEPAGQQGIKYRACDATTFLCSEAWWVVTVPNHAPTGAFLEVPTVECGTTITITSPITDVDNNIDWNNTVILDSCADPCPASVGSIPNTFDFVVPESGDGRFGFNVRVEDTWGWSNSQWVEVVWNCV